MTPRATYRVQFHANFRFDHGAALADYLADLGISHLYASPIATARAGSTHGYDVVDPGQINPELGGEAGFRAMAATTWRSAALIIPGGWMYWKKERRVRSRLISTSIGTPAIQRSPENYTHPF
jgi:hypothetical protein